MSKKLTAEEIAEMADRGIDITPYLSNPEKGYADKINDSQADSQPGITSKFCGKLFETTDAH